MVAIISTIVGILERLGTVLSVGSGVRWYFNRDKARLEIINTQLKDLPSEDLMQAFLKHERDRLLLRILRRVDVDEYLASALIPFSNDPQGINWRDVRRAAQYLFVDPEGKVVVRNIGRFKRWWNTGQLLVSGFGLLLSLFGVMVSLRLLPTDVQPFVTYASFSGFEILAVWAYRRSVFAIRAADRISQYLKQRGDRANSAATMQSKKQDVSANSHTPSAPSKTGRTR
jgi:hypothetical protein